MSETTDAEWVAVAARSDLPAGQMLAVNAGTYEVALYDVGGELFATDNECTHAMAMLTDGTLEGDVVECPLHGGRFCVRTGAGLGPPIPCDVRTYEVRVRDGEIELKLPGLF
jgi:nitrite reductase/ring-hydroxylating ferredoxin subunit